MPIRVHVRRKPDRDHLQLWYRCPLTGRQVTKSADTDLPREAERAAAKWESELAAGMTTHDPSWELFRVLFSDQHLIHKSASTRRSYRSALNWFEKIIGKPKHLSLISAEILSRFASELVRQKSIESTATAVGVIRHVRSALSWAAKTGLVYHVPKIVMPSLAGNRMMRGRPLTEDEFRLMIEPENIAKGIAAVEKQEGMYPSNLGGPGHRKKGGARHRESTERPESGETVANVARLMNGLWRSGLRLQEARQLQWDSPPIRVDLEDGKFPRLIFRAAGQKSRRDEIVPITPDFAEFLRATPVSERQGLVFPSSTRVGRVISAIGQVAGIVVNHDNKKYASAHDLRRSFCTRWSKKVRPVVLQRLARHASIQTTLKYYVDQDSDDIGEQLYGAGSSDVLT